uniref:Uncharacterized protein n=1 Tax=Meloidogyne enterolobii TaxID=390850 RepID=A0A6V7UGV7_MELEN|nr:unnamed protein product [Meloidogyne enterolobii]
MPRPRPQPFPFIASRRRASTASHNALPSSYSFNFGSNLPGNRHSLPRLSITSLGSVAKTFSGLAAFIVPEEQSDKERFRELRIASQRRASLAISRGKNGGTPTTINDNSSKDSSRNSIKHNEDEEDKTSSESSDRNRMPKLYRESKTIHSNTSKMRSSSAKPIPRSQPFNNNNNNNSTIPDTRHNPSQNGKLIQQNNRDISRNRSSTLTKQNGTGNASNGVAINRAPSMPPRIINRRYAHIKR